MTLARSDLWNDTCLTKEFTNSTLNSTILNYSTDNEDLTIYYGCYANFSNNSQTPSNQFNCSSNNANKRVGFYLTGPVPTDPVLSITTCSVGVTVKILKTAAFELTSNRSTLKDALRKGFNVNYSNCSILQPCPKPGIPDFIKLMKGFNSILVIRFVAISSVPRKVFELLGYYLCLQ